MNENLFEIKGENLISVCAWCFPARTILEKCNWLPAHVQISHGICQAHLKQQLALLDRPAAIPVPTIAPVLGADGRRYPV